MEIKFSSDTKYRKEWLTGLHFAHPAKMHLSLQLWLIDRYTKEGEVILDPMAGSGTILVACSTGRNVIARDLEDKFIKMMDGNWKKIQQRGPQLGYKMGWAKILQGDARKLPDMLANVVITSPPYAESVSVNQGGERESHQEKRAARLEKAGFNPKDYQGGHGRNLQQDWAYGNSEGNIGNLPYGKLADVIMTSPPYGIPATSQESSKDEIERRISKGIKGAVITEKGECMTGNGKRQQRYSDNPNNLGNLPYGNIDCVITSPPYEGTEARDRSQEIWWNEEREKQFSGGSAKIAKGYQSQQSQGLFVHTTEAFFNLPSELGDRLSDTLFSGTLGDEFQKKFGVLFLTLEKWDKFREELSKVSVGGHLATPDMLSTLCNISPHSDTEFREFLTSPYNGFLVTHTECHSRTQPIPVLLMADMETSFSIKQASQVSPITLFNHQPYCNRYSKESQIGNLRGQSYLSAMLEVYQGCWRVLKPQGLMILVTKNFIRNKQEIRLDFDTIRLCEQAGFRFAVRHYRKLTSQSFWRTIYQQKYPDAPILDKEDIMIFQK